MDCASAREALSARLDGELLSVERVELDAHLAVCPACRRWREDAHEVTRRFRLGSAQTVASPSEELLAALGSGVRRRHRPQGVTLVRAALVAVAVAQLVWVTVPTLLFGSDRGAPIHVSHEMGSFDLALAVGFLVAAYRPARAQGMRALVGAAALLLIVTALIDLASARTSVGDEAPHLLAVAGWLLLRELAALSRPHGDDRAVPLRTVLRRLRAHQTPGSSMVSAKQGDDQPWTAPGYGTPAAIGSADAFGGGMEPEQKRAAAG
jgi:predicted anti-sigma-YlaC factor YlaD